MRNLFFLLLFLVGSPALAPAAEIACRTLYAELGGSSAVQRSNRRYRAYQRAFAESDHKKIDRFLAGKVRLPEGATKLQKFAAMSYYSRKNAAFGLEAHRRIVVLNPAWEELVIDPGLVAHLDRFESFVREREGVVGKMSAIEVRAAFSAHLGSRRVYRALALTEDQLAEVRRVGLLSHAARELTGAPQTEPTVWSRAIETRLIGTPRATDPLVSVSDHSRVATAVVTDSLQNGSSDRILKPYLFEIQLPEIDRIEPVAGSFAANNLYTQGGSLVVFTERGTHHYSLNGGVESFVAGGISPQDITSVKPLKNTFTYRFTEY